MFIMDRRSLVVLLAAVPLLAGCQHAAAPVTTGHSSFVFVDEAKLAGRKPVELAQEREAVDVLDAAGPIEPLAQPVYPKAALARDAGFALVGVRIHVDADGRVTDVDPSMVCFSTPGPFAADFRAAVDAAVWQWKFHPAKRRHLEPVQLDDGSRYWRATSEVAVESVFDLAFTFSAEGGVTHLVAR